MNSTKEIPDLFDKQLVIKVVKPSLDSAIAVLEGLNLIRNQKTESLLLQNKMVLEAEFFKLNLC